MTGVVSVADHMAAIVDHLASLNIGYAAPPAQHGWVGPPGQSEFVRYGIAWRIGSRDRERWSLDGGFTQANLLIFIRCFAETHEAAEQHLDAVAARMLERGPGGWALTVPGRTVIDIRQDNGSTTTDSTYTEVPLPESGDFFVVRTDPGGAT